MRKSGLSGFCHYIKRAGTGTVRKSRKNYGDGKGLFRRKMGKGWRKRIIMH